MCLIVSLCGISNFEKIKKLGFFSIANPVLSYFQYKFPQCLTSKLRKKERQGNKKIIFDKENVYTGIRTHDPWV